MFLGAHSIYSNGAVYSRAGTALVAMMAKQRNVPVVVCCETYKFSEGILVDGFGKNELGMPPSWSYQPRCSHDVHSPHTDGTASRFDAYTYL